MSRMFIARSRARSGAREVVLNTGCERQSDVASLCEALLKRTAQGESQSRPRGQQGIDLQKSASLSRRRANSMSGTFRRVIPEALDMLQHIEAADGEAHGEVVHISPTCGQDSAENSGGNMRHTLNPNLADFMRLTESILDKQQAKLVVIENVPGELKSGVFRRLSWHGGCACDNPRATPLCRFLHKNNVHAGRERPPRGRKEGHSSGEIRTETVDEEERNEERPESGRACATEEHEGPAWTRKGLERSCRLARVVSAAM